MKNKLIKIKKQGKISGVCAGIAKFLDIDVSLIRLLWIIFTLFYGFGLLLYIICALVLPDEEDI